MGRWMILGLIILLAIGWLGCLEFEEDEEAEREAARQAQAEVEHQLNQVRLTRAAVKRLSVQAEPARRKTRPVGRSVAATVVPVPGYRMVLTAPGPAMAFAAAGHPFPVPGDAFRKGELLFRLAILPVASSLPNVEDELKLRQAELAVARARVHRLASLIDAGATSLRELQEAREALTRAEVAYRFARARLQLLNHPQAALDSAKLPEVEVRAPFDGVVQQVGTSPGSQISDGAPLLSFVQTNPLWVEVPLLPEEVAQLDLARGALVYELSPAKGAKARIARFVRRQPGADARTLQTRLYFQLDNPDNRFLPGQKVRATLFYPRQAQQLVIPAAALTIDMFGGTWVYEQTADTVFTRRRVQVDHFVGADSLVVRGIAPDSRIVVTGVSELFGSEFGNFGGEEEEDD